MKRAGSRGLLPAPPPDKHYKKFTLKNALPVLKKAFTQEEIKGRWAKTTDETENTTTSLFQIQHDTQWHTALIIEYGTSLKIPTTHIGKKTTDMMEKCIKNNGGKTSHNTTENKEDNTMTLQTIDKSIFTLSTTTGGVDTYQSDDWINQLNQFAIVSEKKWKKPPQVKNGNTAFKTTIHTYKIKGKEKYVTLTFYPNSGKFNYNGTETLREKYRQSVESLIEYGLGWTTTSPPTSPAPKQKQIQIQHIQTENNNNTDPLDHTHTPHTQMTENPPEKKSNKNEDTQDPTKNMDLLSLTDTKSTETQGTTHPTTPNKNQIQNQKQPPKTPQKTKPDDKHTTTKDMETWCKTTLNSLNDKLKRTTDTKVSQLKISHMTQILPMIYTNAYISEGNAQPTNTNTTEYIKTNITNLFNKENKHVKWIIKQIELETTEANKHIKQNHINKLSQLTQFDKLKELHKQNSYLHNINLGLMKSLQLMQQSQQKQSETINKLEEEMKKNKTNIDKQFKTINENTKNITKPHLNDYEHIRKALIDKKLHSDQKMKTTWPFFLKSTGESLSEQINTINNTLETIDTNFNNKTKTDTLKIKNLENTITDLQEQLKNTQDQNQEITEYLQKTKQQMKKEKNEQISKEKLLIAKIISEIIDKGYDIHTHDNKATEQKETTTKRQTRAWGSSNDSDSSQEKEKRKKKKKQKKTTKPDTKDSSESSSDTFSDDETFQKIKTNKALWSHNSDEHDKIFREFYLRIRPMVNKDKTFHTKATYNAIRFNRFNQEEQRELLKEWAKKLDDEDTKANQTAKIDKYVKRLMKFNTEFRNAHNITDD